MASEIKVDTIVNAGGDNDTGIDLATNDQILLKVANATRLTMNSTGQTTIVGEGGSTTTSLQQGLTKVWAKTTADGTSLEDSFNVSSLGDTASGQQTINFSNNMNNDDHAPTHSFVDNQTDIAPWIDSVTTSSYKQNSYHSGSYIDRKHASSVNGDLA